MDRKEFDELMRDGYRFLAQKRERSELILAEPSEIDALPVPEMTPQKRQHHPVKPEVNSKTESESRRGKLLKNRDPNCPEPDPSWKNFAPEPKSVNPIPGEFEDPYPQYKTLAQFNQAICNCMKCPLGEKRNKIVFGVGDPDADLLLVGEAPGADEDRHGEPFVGRAGQLLDKILAAIDLERGKDVYIANILKCRPPDNRDPVASEVAQCESHLLKQIQLIKPKLILALGRIAGQTILNSSQSLTNLRGQFHDYHGVPLMVTFHPAALLRNPNWKKPTWEDVQLMKAKLMELKAEEKDA